MQTTKAKKTAHVKYLQIRRMTPLNSLCSGPRMRVVRRFIDSRTFLALWASISTLLLVLRHFSPYGYDGYIRGSRDSPSCPYVWHGGSPSHNGSCWCSSDAYCMCTPSIAIDCIIEVWPKGSSHDVLTSPPSGVVLVLRSQPPSEHYAIVGGFVKVGETVEAAVLREVKEETNLNVSHLRLLGVYSDPKRDARRHTASVVYVASVDSTDALRSGDDAKRALVVPIDKLLSLRLAFDHKSILQDYLQSYKHLQT